MPRDHTYPHFAAPSAPSLTRQTGESSRPSVARTDVTAVTGRAPRRDPWRHGAPPANQASCHRVEITRQRLDRITPRVSLDDRTLRFLDAILWPRIRRRRDVNPPASSPLTPGGCTDRDFGITQDPSGSAHSTWGKKFRNRLTRATLMAELLMNSPHPYSQGPVRPKRMSPSHSAQAHRRTDVEVPGTTRSNNACRSPGSGV